MGSLAHVLMTVGVMCVGFAGGLLGSFAYEYQQIRPIPDFHPLDCYYDGPHEPWHMVADGQVLIVGTTKYLAVSREQRNSQDRYSGYKTYGFEIDMTTADRTWAKTECPKTWLR